jgi:hypothetical protein
MNIELELLSKTELEQFKQDLISAVKLIFTQTGASNKKWLRSDEVMKMLSLSSSGLQNLRINGTIPFTKLGGLIYYDFSEIVKILEANKKPAIG